MGANDQDGLQSPSRPNYQAQKGGGVAYCPGYTDADGNWNNGFPCRRWGGPDESYCCGDDRKRFCCPERQQSPVGTSGQPESQQPQPPQPPQPQPQPGRTMAEQRSTPKSRSQSGSDRGDPEGQVVTPAYFPDHSGGGGGGGGGRVGGGRVEDNFFQSIGFMSGDVRFPLVPAILAFSLTAILLTSIIVLVCCCFCPTCPGAKRRRRRREAKSSKFIKTTSVNLEAEETAAAIAAQALVSITGGGGGGGIGGGVGVGGERNHSSLCCDGNQMLSLYANSSVGKGHAVVMSGSSSTNSSLPRGCVDFGCRGRQVDTGGDQTYGVASQGCFQHKAPAASLRGHHMKHFHGHVTDQLVDSSSSSLQGLVGAGHFARNSPTTTASTSNSWEDQGQSQLGHVHPNPNPNPNPNPPLGHPYAHQMGQHGQGQLWTCEGRPRLMNVDNLVTALYQNGHQHHHHPRHHQHQSTGSELAWKQDIESSMMCLTSLNKELNGNIYASFPNEANSGANPCGMDDNSIKKWLSSTGQQLTPKRSLFGKPLKVYQTDGTGDALQQQQQQQQLLLPDQTFVQSARLECGLGAYPDVARACMSEKQPFLDGKIDESVDSSASPFCLKPDLTSSTFEEPGLSAVDVPNCPQLKLTSGEWLPKLRYESSFHLVP